MPVVLRAGVSRAGRGALLCTVFAPEDCLVGRGGREEELLEGVCPLPGLPGPATVRKLFSHLRTAIPAGIAVSLRPEKCSQHICTQHGTTAS